MEIQSEPSSSKTTEIPGRDRSPLCDCPPGYNPQPPGPIPKRRSKRKRFQFKQQLPDDAERPCCPCFTFSSFENSNINYLSTESGVYLFECGKLRSTSWNDPSKHHSQTIVLPSNSVPTNNETPPNQVEERPLLELLRQKRTLFNKILQDTDPLIFDICRKLRSSLPCGNFKSVILSSPEEHCWDCLHALFLDESGHRHPDLTLDSIILHGCPTRYSNTFITILGILKEEYPEMKIWFTSYSPEIEDVILLERLKDERDAVTPALFFHHFSGSGQSVYKDLSGNNHHLSFEKYLQTEQTLRIVFPALNHFHIPIPSTDRNRLMWFIPEMRTNQDCLAISIHISTQGDKFMDYYQPSIFRIFLSSNCTKSIFNLIRAVNVNTKTPSNIHHDILCYNHNGVGELQDEEYEMTEFFNATRGRVAIVPSGESFHYPRKEIHESIANRCDTIKSHLYVYYRLENTGVMGEATVKHYCREITNLNRAVFSLHKPLHLKFSENMCAIQQNST